MTKVSKIIYGFLVVIAVSAHIGTAFAVNDSVSTNSKKVEFVDSSKNISHEKISKDSDLKVGQKDSVSPLDRWVMAIIKAGYGSSLCSVNVPSNLNTAAQEDAASFKPIVIESNQNLNKSVIRRSLKRNEYCKNKSYAHSAMHVFTQGFSKGFHEILCGRSLMLSYGNIGSTYEIDRFAGHFNDFITGKVPFDFMYVSDKFFRLFDLSINLRRQENAKCDNITQEFSCSNNLTQDPDKFIKGMLTILGMEKSPLITSQVEIRSFYAKHFELKNDGSNTTSDNVEELTTVQTISLEKNYANIDDFFKFLCVWRFNGYDHEEVRLHVDTEKFSHLIVKFKIFEDSLDYKCNSIVKKVGSLKREIINLSENVNIEVNDIKDLRSISKKDVVKYKLTPRAAISHKGDTLEGGHFVAKILTEKPSEKKEGKWTMYDKNKEVSVQKRSEVAPRYDDYIIVYEANKEFD